MTKQYFDSDYFAKEALSRKIPDRELIISKAESLSKAEFLSWLEQHFDETIMPNWYNGETLITDLVMMGYEESWLTKEEILDAMQDEVDSVQRAKKKAKKEILRLKALLS